MLRKFEKNRTVQSKDIDQNIQYLHFFPYSSFIFFHFFELGTKFMPIFDMPKRRVKMFQLFLNFDTSLLIHSTIT